MTDADPSLAVITVAADLLETHEVGDKDNHGAFQWQHQKGPVSFMTTHYEIIYKNDQPIF